MLWPTQEIAGLDAGESKFALGPERDAVTLIHDVFDLAHVVIEGRHVRECSRGGAPFMHGDFRPAVHMALTGRVFAPFGVRTFATLHRR